MATITKQKNPRTNEKGSRGALLNKKTLNIGDICTLKITALAPNNVGIDEFSYPFAVFVPNAKYGNKVKAKILTIENFNKDYPYAVAKLIETVVSTKGSVSSFNAPVKPGDVLDVTITKQSKNHSSTGIVELTPNYKLIVPLGSLIENKGANQSSLSLSLPKTVKVTVTRVKANYAFGSLVSDNPQESSSSQESQASTFKTGLFNKVTSLTSYADKLVLGSKFTTVLPKNLRTEGTNPNKQYGIVKGKDTVLLIKLKKGVVLGKDKVRIKIIAQSTKYNFVIGKILKVYKFSISKTTKSKVVMNSIREMLSNGMHFGEKAIRCHIRMKPYIWTAPVTNAVGVIGERNKNKVRPVIKGRGRHVINLLKTRRCLNNALNSLTKDAVKGRTFLFIGTKKPARDLVARAAFFTKNSFYINTRWLGGMLTNWKTICKSISKIRPILKQKQKIVRDILERRQAIKARLIKKALLFKTKSKLILIKGRNLFNVLKNSTKKNEIALRYQKLETKRNTHITKGMDLIQKQRKLIQKHRELVIQTLLLKEKGFQIMDVYKDSYAQLAVYTKKLREYKYLLTLTKEIQQLQKNVGPNNECVVNTSAPEGRTRLYSLPYENLKGFQQELKPWIVPNPPKEILNRMANIIKNGSSVSQAKSTTGNIVVCSTLLLRFSRQFSTYIKTVIKTLVSNIKTLSTQCNNSLTQLNTIKTTLQNYVSLKNQYVTSLQQLKIQLKNERSVVQIVKRQLKALDAQKKFIKFLPRLRYLATPQTKISSLVQILLSKIVDPKLKYSIDTIYDEKLSHTSKKLAAERKKKWQLLEKYFGGVVNMKKLAQSIKRGNTVAIIIGQKEEMSAVRECQKLGIKTYTIVDTNCNPSLSNHIIPANDDSRNSIKYILKHFITRIRLAQKIRTRISTIKKKPA